MICRDCGTEAAPKYRESCPRCGGELAEPKAPEKPAPRPITWGCLTINGIDVSGFISDVSYSSDE